jgi:hypothetical protein
MRQPSRRCALCVANLGYEASLIVNKVYRVIPDPAANQDDLLRIVDESGEDYLCDRQLFVSVQFPRPVAARLELGTSKAANRKLQEWKRTSRVPALESDAMQTKLKQEPACQMNQADSAEGVS